MNLNVLRRGNYIYVQIVILSIVYLDFIFELSQNKGGNHGNNINNVNHAHVMIVIYIMYNIPLDLWFLLLVRNKDSS